MKRVIPVVTLLLSYNKPRKIYKLIATTNIALVPTIHKKSKPRELVNSVVDKLTITSQYKGIRLVNNFYSDIPEIIIADSYRLEAILTQLITNAVNFTEKGSVIVTTYFFPEGMTILQNDKDYNSRKTPEVQKAKDILQFTVHDTGIGLSEEKQQYLYKQLNGLDSSSDSTNEELQSNSNLELTLKLGLGLSLVKQFIYEVNGKIDVSSQQGKSTTFTLQVPIILHSTEDINNDNNMTNNH